MIEGSAAVLWPRPPGFSMDLDDAPWGNILVHQPDAAERWSCSASSRSRAIASSARRRAWPMSSVPGTQ